VTGEAAVHWADVPFMLTEWAGYGQTGPAGQPLPDSLVVLVGDYYGEPVAGATVTWTVTDSDGMASPTSGVSDAQGFVATQYTLGSVNYPVQEVIATAAAVADTAYFYEYLDGGLAPPRITESVTPQRNTRPLELRDREPRPVRQPPSRPQQADTLNIGERR
ncbi:MAG TPA: Ig-like domain-containing protein, partial [Longimicrobiales bacterium]